MQITDIKVRKINAEGRMKAVVSVTFDDAFAKMTAIEQKRWTEAHEANKQITISEWLGGE